MIMLVWNQWKVPQRWRDALTKVLHENKDMNECGSYRVISIVAHAGSAILKIVATRLSAYYEAKERLPEEQCGFRPDCSTIDIVFLVRRLQGRAGRKARVPLSWASLIGIFPTTLSIVDFFGRCSLALEYS